MFLTSIFDLAVPLILSPPFSDYEKDIREKLSKSFIRNYF